MSPDPLADRVTEIRRRLTEGLSAADPHHRLAGHPVSYHVVDGEALEIVFRDVPSITDAEIDAIKRLFAGKCSCTVAPQTAETVVVRFVAAVA